MLVVETIARIRLEHLGKGVPIKQIARELRLSRNTVQKVVRSNETSVRHEHTVQPLPKLGPWMKELERRLEANEGEKKRDRLSMLRIFEALAERGYRRITIRAISIELYGRTTTAIQPNAQGVRTTGTVGVQRETRLGGASRRSHHCQSLFPGQQPHRRSPRSRRRSTSTRVPPGLINDSNSPGDPAGARVDELIGARDSMRPPA